MIEQALIRATSVYIQKGLVRPKKKRKRGAWDESLHPREKKGISTGGRFRSASGGSGKKLPPWKRDRRRAAWVRSLAPEEQEAMARVFYEKLWKELAPYLGEQGQPPPGLAFLDAVSSGTPAQVYQDANGIRQVQLDRNQIMRMALNPASPDEQFILAHEWRHVFQNAILYSTERDRPHNDQPIEQDATNFANRVLEAMRKNRRRRKKKKKPIQPYVINPGPISENLGRPAGEIRFP